MANSIQKLKRVPESFSDWPEKLKSADDIQLFEDIIKSLSLGDSLNQS